MQMGNKCKHGTQNNNNNNLNQKTWTQDLSQYEIWYHVKLTIVRKA